jgi:hypothetical protein
MSLAYTKLFSSITESTVWCGTSPALKIVWITMLAKADKIGRVHMSIPGLAKLAEVSIQEAEDAIEKLLQPDTYSRTHDYEGRRVETIDGGWRLLNFSKYRDLINEEERKAYKAEHARKSRAAAKELTFD